MNQDNSTTTSPYDRYAARAYAIETSEDHALARLQKSLAKREGALNAAVSGSDYTVSRPVVATNAPALVSYTGPVTRAKAQADIYDTLSPHEKRKLCHRGFRAACRDSRRMKAAADAAGVTPGIRYHGTHGCHKYAVRTSTKSAPETGFVLVGKPRTSETWRLGMTNRQGFVYAMRRSVRREKQLQAMWNQQMRANGAALRAIVPMPDVPLLTATCLPTLPKINNGQPHLVSITLPRTDRYVPAPRVTAAQRLGGLE
jgi:hypothetical protein